MANKLLTPKKCFLGKFRLKINKIYFLKSLFKSETNSLVIPNIAVCDVNEGKVTLEIRVFYKSFEVSFSKSKFPEGIYQ